MIAIAIMGIMFTVGPTLLINITRFSRLSQARLETQRSARESLSIINRTIRQAQKSTISISQETNQPPYSSISFSTVDGRTMKYYQSGLNLFQVQNGSTRTLEQNLKYIAFTYPRTDDSSILSVSVTFEKSTYEGASKALQMAIEKVRIMND
jgi:type II secretory pathway component PulJ